MFVDEEMKQRTAGFPSAGGAGEAAGSPAGEPRPDRAAFDRRFDEAVARVWHVVSRRTDDRESAERQTAAVLRELFSTLAPSSSDAQFSAHCTRVLAAACEEAESKRRRPAASAAPR